MPQRLLSSIALIPAGALPFVDVPPHAPTIPLTSAERLEDLTNAGIDILHVPEVAHELRTLKKLEDREFWMDLVTKREMMGCFAVACFAFLIGSALWLNGHA